MAQAVLLKSLVISGLYLLSGDGVHFNYVQVC